MRTIILKAREGFVRNTWNTYSEFKNGRDFKIIKAIKAVRQLSSLDLKEAKAIIDSVSAGGTVPFNVDNTIDSRFLSLTIDTLFDAGFSAIMSTDALKKYSRDIRTLAAKIVLAGDADFLAKDLLELIEKYHYNEENDEGEDNE